METEWLKEVLQRPNEKRFAICTHPDNKYIGNVFFTNIDDESAELHIFIGDVNYWGGNRAADTIRLFMEYAFDKMKLKRVDSIINPENKNAVTMADYFGFVVVEKIVDEVSGIVYSKYCLTRETFITVNPNSRQTTTTSHNYE
jgi:RimJ/RimL family protein N-acetyltransferase